MQKIEKELTKIKYSCFGKVKIYKKNKEVKKLESLQLKKYKILHTNEEDKDGKLEAIDEEMASVLKLIERNNLEVDIKRLENLNSNKGRSAAVFGLRDMILGRKKSPQEQVVIKDPETGNEVSTPDEIKRVSLRYLVNLLSNNPPGEQFKGHVERLKTLHFERMREVYDEDNKELSKETFEKTLKVLSSKPGNKYRFLTNTGTSFRNALFNLFQTAWRTEELPRIWHESTVIQLKKGKRDDNDLDDIRHIHDRNIYSKVFSHMVMAEVKPLVFENMSKYQIACRPGHRPSEHLFVLKSVIANYMKEKKPMILASYDLRKFFDSENIFDILSELYSSKVRGKMYRLVYQMNKNVQIKVKTAVGLSESEQTGPGASQGSVDAPIISSNSIGNGVSDAFATSKVEARYPNVELSAQIYMDDIARLAENVASAQYANEVMEELLGKKSLKLNLDKSSFLVIGTKKSRRAISNEIMETPLKLGGEAMKEDKAIRYLGDFLTFNLEESVHLTVVKRLGVARQILYEIRAVIEDLRAQRLGSLGTAFDIYEQSVLQMILVNSETWVSIPRKTMKILDDFFHFFC